MIFLRRRSLRWLGRRLGELAYALGIRRRIASANLARAFPDKPLAERRRILRRAYRNIGAGVLELWATSRLTPTDVDSVLEYQGFEIFERLFAEGHGVVVASAHLGSWEFLAAAGARLGVPLHLVTRTLRGRANAALVRARARSGLREIAPRGALRQGVAALRRGEVVVNLIDQNMLPKRGVFVDFFGQPACTTPANALMSRRARAPVILAVAVNLPDGKTRLCIEGPFPVPNTGDVRGDVRTHTQTLTRVLEGYIRAHPDQWFWVHRRWKTQPQPEDR